MNYLEIIEADHITNAILFSSDNTEPVTNLELNLPAPWFHKIRHVRGTTRTDPGHFITQGHSQGDTKIYTPSTFDKANQVKRIAFQHHQAQTAGDPKQIATSNARLPGDLTDPAHKLAK